MQQKWPYQIRTENHRNNNYNYCEKKETKDDKHVFRLKQKTLKIRKKKNQNNIRKFKQATCSLNFTKFGKY